MEVGIQNGDNSSMEQDGTEETLPLSRLGTYDVGVIGRKKHHITGILEVDVTVARERLRAMRRAGSAVSFTGWFTKSVARVVEENPEVHGVLRGRRKRHLFAQVDIALMVEREVEGKTVPLPLVLRDCTNLSLQAVESKLASALTQPVEGARDYELGRRRSPLLIRLFFRLPQPIRIRSMERILNNPFRRKATMGTVMITSVAAGMRFPGWIIPKSMHNLVFGLGSVVRKPRVVGDRMVPRDVLHLTVLIDHDVVDGAPAARFVSKLVKALESAAVLPE